MTGHTKGVKDEDSLGAGFAATKSIGSRRSMTANIVVEDYHKNYGKTVAVAGISFEVAPGEILGLLCPNGAGKTTTLRALAVISQFHL